MTNFENSVFSSPLANHEIERQVIGSLLNDPDTVDKIGDTLIPDFFSDPFHRGLYGRLMASALAGEPIDATMLSQGMNSEDRTKIVDISGRRSDGSISVKHVATLRELWQRRELQAVGEEISTVAATAIPPEQIITQFQDRVDKISLPIESEMVSSAEAYDRLFESIDEAFLKANQTDPRTPVLPGLLTGYSVLDDMMGGFQNGHMILVGGRPSQGKSAWLTNVAQNMGLRGEEVGFISYEMTTQQMMLRGVSAHSGVASDRIVRGDWDDDEYAEAYISTNVLRNLPITWVYNPGNIDKLLLTMRKLVRVKKCKAIFIDYVNLVPGGVGSNSTEKLGYISAMLKGAAANLNVPVIVACQLNRNLESRDDQRPQLSDLKQSGNLEQDADSVIFLHREIYFIERRRPDSSDPKFAAWQIEFNRWDGRAELILRKNRHGRIGEAEVGFDASTTRFYDRAA
jgi:replicative DNA helicase